MANVRNLKKDINYVLGDIIDAVTMWQITNPTENLEKGEVIIDEAIDIFDDLIQKVNLRKVENKKAHFRGIKNELEERASGLVEKINQL